MPRTTRTITADICLYGTSRTGAGFLGCRLDHGQITGTGEPVEGRSFTEAAWLAVDALRGLGVESGMVRIFAPGGERMAVVDIRNVPAFGDLKWEAAVVWTISAKELVAAAKQ